MKIQNEQLQALQQRIEAKKARPGAQGVFDALLAEELNASAETGQATSGQALSVSPTVLGLSGITASQGVAELAGATELAAVASSIDAMLSGLDDYAETLSSPQGADLRKAFGILRGMDENLAALRETSPDLATRHAGMAALVNEISVIARAETVKLNRGDYL